MHTTSNVPYTARTGRVLLLHDGYRKHSIRTGRQSVPSTGTLICNDAWAFPSRPMVTITSWNKYADLGVSTMFVSANCSTDEFDPIIYTWHENHLQMHAQLNGMNVVIASAPTDMRGGTISLCKHPAAL